MAAAIAACGGSSNSAPPAPGSSFDGGGGTLLDGTTVGQDDAPNLLVGVGDTGPTCVNLQCQQQACAGGGTTSVSGTVYAPNGTLPLYNVIVYVPTARRSTAGSTPGGHVRPVRRRSRRASRSRRRSATRRALRPNDVPAGANVPLVVQLGKWRRQYVHLRHRVRRTTRSPTGSPRGSPRISRKGTCRTSPSPRASATAWGACCRSSASTRRSSACSRTDSTRRSTSTPPAPVARPTSSPTRRWPARSGATSRF